MVFKFILIMVTIQMCKLQEANLEHSKLKKNSRILVNFWLNVRAKSRKKLLHKWQFPLKCDNNSQSFQTFVESGYFNRVRKAEKKARF